MEDIVSRNATELRKTFFGDDDEEAKTLKWTREQAWALTKGLSRDGEVRLLLDVPKLTPDLAPLTEQLKYADVLVNAPFKSDESAVRPCGRLVVFATR